VLSLARGAQCHMAVLLYYSCICPWRIRITLETQTRQAGVSCDFHLAPFTAAPTFQRTAVVLSYSVLAWRGSLPDMSTLHSHVLFLTTSGSPIQEVCGQAPSTVFPSSIYRASCFPDITHPFPMLIVGQVHSPQTLACNGG
jgi:hypothetical protein